MDTNAAIFPENVLVNVLTRLPAKTLHRFKCISKHWHSLITSPRFLSFYLTLSPPHPSSWILTNREAQIIPPSGPFSPLEAQQISFSLTEPPNISQITLMGFSRLWTHPQPPSTITSSNGLILVSTQTQAHHLVLINPVTTHRTLLPYCGDIMWLNHVALAVKYTAKYNDVRLVVIELQTSDNPFEEAASLLRFRSDIGEWERLPAFCKEVRRRGPYLWKADLCFEDGGRMFWVNLSCGVLVLDDPFFGGDRMEVELRFIPFPELPNDDNSRRVYPSGGFVQLSDGNEVWRLTDVEKGEWILVFISGLPPPEEGFLGRLTVLDYHPLEPEVALMYTADDKSILVNLKEGKVVGNIGTWLRFVEDAAYMTPYLPVVLPPWPTPIPNRLCAISAKENGNIYFKNKNFKEALKIDVGCPFPFTVFPDEIILEILIRLTPKSICRLKCLSKPWLSFISSYRFLSAYTSLSAQPSSWILVDRAGRFSPGPSPSLSFSPSLPPNITYLTLSGLPSRLTKPGPPTIITSSNGLILFSLTPSNHLYICNPVTRDWAPLPIPDCGKINTLPRVALAAKYSSTCDVVSLVVTEFQSSLTVATLLTYRSATGQWEAKPASFRAGSKAHHMCCADGSFQVNGKLFWIDLSCGLVVDDDPFGERVELRFIPLPPKGPTKSPRFRFVFPVGGFVQCMIRRKDNCRIWRLNDVEKGEWGLLYKVDDIDARLAKNGMPRIRGLGLSASHPLDGDYSYWIGEDKVVVVNMLKGEVVDMISYPKNAEVQGSYMPVVLPTWPTPLPLSLGATSAKERGNVFFREKKFKDSIFHYSRSIYLLPTAVAYTNRAAANFQLGKYPEAENDCSEAIKIDDQYLKVYVYRANARKKLGKLWEAKEDAQIALKLDPEHQEILKLFAEINCSLEKPGAKGITPNVIVHSLSLTELRNSGNEAAKRK